MGRFAPRYRGQLLKARSPRPENPSGIAVPARARRTAPYVRGRYDLAQTGHDNVKHWSMADGLSARAAHSWDVRYRLYSRSRYEVANNSYAKGIALTLANDCVGTGPRLQLLTPDREQNRAIEHAFSEWSRAIGLGAKLRTMREARAVDGEAFGLLVNNPRLETPAQLDLRLIECDQVHTPALNPLDLYAVDGIELDQHYNPVVYHVLKTHPGDLIPIAWQFDRIPARGIIHWFRADRPGQFRGVPEMTPALPLFAQLRRYTLATLAAAETAADFAAVLYSDAPPDGEALEGEPFELLEIEKRMLTTLPAGWKLAQFKAEQPATSYADFKHEILNEIARCLNIPFNVAAGNSSGYNYSSGRLDLQTYFKSLKIDRSHLELICLDRIFAAWLDEMSLATSLIGSGPARLGGWPHQWFWDGSEHVDPLKEADAQKVRLENFTTTLASEYAARGLDWEAQLRQRALELALAAELGLPAALPAPPAPGLPRRVPTPTPDPNGPDRVDDPED